MGRWGDKPQRGSGLTSNMIATLVTTQSIKSSVSEFLKRMQPRGWKDRGAFDVISGLHEIFEEVHYNCIEIFREFSFNVIQEGVSLEKSRKKAVEEFLNKRTALEVGRHELRQDIDGLLKTEWCDSLKEYTWAVAMYFLNEEDHGFHPSAVGIFFLQAKRFEGAGTVGDRYFDTPSMRFSRQLAELTGEAEIQSAVKNAINGLSCKRQSVQAAFLRQDFWLLHKLKLSRKLM